MKKHQKILFFIFAFSLFTFAFLPAILNGTPAFPAVGNWYQQFMPNLGGAQITDILFTDSLSGYSVTSLRTANDSAFILKTSNSGDTWNIIYRNNRSSVKVKFINSTTGFTNSFTTIFKTTNSGLNWTPIALPGIFGDDMAVLNDSTIYLAMSESLTGGVFRTTNGGANWEQQINVGSANPDKIYMYNQRIGFCSGGGQLRRTTNSGLNWNVIGGGDIWHMEFADSLTGWYSSIAGMKKTTDGGLNWVTQIIPSGGIIQNGVIGKFDIINKDTLFGTGGGVMYPNGQFRGIIYRTINGGENWLFQVPDTSIHISGYTTIKFVNINNGWLYNFITLTGIHTSSGADPIWLLGIQQIGNNIPSEYKLFQNYPNPFNPITNIKYQIINNNSNVKLEVYDVTGKNLITLVNQKQNAGTYLIDWNSSDYSSGVYFYKLTVINGKEVFTDTKKMILIK